MSKKSRLLVPIAFLILIGLVIAGLYAIGPDRGNGGASGEIAANRPPLGESLAAFAWTPVPKDISEVQFKDGAGRDIRLADFEGQVLLVNLWATWCGPCRHEMPSLNALQEEKGGDDFQVIAISLDRAGPEVAQDFLTETGAEALTLYIDESSDTGRKLGVFGLPATLLIDRNGKELGRLLGPAEWNDEAAHALIDWAISR